MNNRKDNFSVFDSFNIFTNSISLSTGLLTSVLVVGLIGAIIGVTISGTLLKSWTHFNVEYFGIYIDTLTSWSNTITVNGKEVDRLHIKNLVEAKLLKSVFTITVSSIIGGALFSFFGYKTISKIVKNASNKKLNDQHLRGTKILNEDQLEKDQKKKNVEGSHITAKARMDRKFEAYHTLITGSSGSGKTVILRRIFSQQREHPDNKDAKFIIHDVKGDWVSKYYESNNPNHHIFNMSDIRGIKFNVFNNINNQDDMESVIATIIPRGAQDKEPIWVDSARGILNGIFVHSIATGNETTKHVKELIKLSAEDLLIKLKEVEGTESAITYLSAGETQVANYMSNFESKIKYFTTLNDCGSKEDFDLDAWIKSEGQSIIFMANNPKYSDLYAVRISVFIESFVNIILSRKENEDAGDKRFYLIVDELGSLEKMKKLVDFLALARSYKGCCTLGVQEIARIDEVFGDKLRQSIVNNCSTKIILRAGDPDTAKKMSEMIGEKEIEQTNISSSVGTEQNRDGMSAAKTVKKEFAVLPAEIMQLNTLEFYLKQPNADWTHIQTKFIPEIDLVEDVEEPFMPCEAGALFKNRGSKTKEELEKIISTPEQDVDNVLSKVEDKDADKNIENRDVWINKKPNPSTGGGTKKDTELDNLSLNTDLSDLGFKESNEIDVDDLSDDELESL